MKRAIACCIDKGYKQPMLRLIRIFSFALLLATGAYLLFVQPRQELGAVEIGGDFTLTDQHGKTVTNESLKGRLRLVYFGFTFCPDICPTALVVMGRAMEKLGSDAIQPVFISVDPARDTVAQLKEYADNFPGLVALTGSAEAVKQAALAYKVYYQKQTPNSETKHPTAQGDAHSVGVSAPPPAEYMIDHSSFIYLMDEDGKYLAHFPHSIAAEVLIERIKQYL